MEFLKPFYGFAIMVLGSLLWVLFATNEFSELFCDVGCSEAHNIDGFNSAFCILAIHLSLWIRIKDF